MNIITVVISVLLCVICVFLTILQRCDIHFMRLKKGADVKPYSPVFEDMIPTGENNNYIADYLEEGEPNESKIVNTLNEALKKNIAAAAAVPAPTTITTSTTTATTTTTSQTPTIILNNNNLYDIKKSEVHNSLRAALAFKVCGKIDKAMKLFIHALNIAPDDPEVLNGYGEFVEDTRNDIVAADEFYFQALTYAPQHQGALVNRARTAHVVDKLDSRILRSIDEKRDALMKLQENHPFFDLIKKQAYYLHIYHTVGIEGNTMSFEELKSVLETGKVVPGKSIMEHNEVLGLELAMKYVKLLIRFPVIEAKEILGIHRRILGHVDPLHSGVLRDKQVFVGNHVPPPPKDLPYLMECYIEWLNSEEAQSMHPVRYAALAHYKLVDIHPFSDGNGRTSRLIMNLILLRAGYPPVMILKRHREKYYEYLNLANKGDVRPFVRFIAHCTEHMIDVYIWAIERLYRDITDINENVSNVNSPTIRIDESNENL